MKIKEVCQQTGLTEKTVRYYVERELLHPQAMEKGDRIYTEFSSEDIRRLERVAALRKAGFSIEAILTMLRTPESVPAIVQVRRRELAEEETNARQLLATFSRLHSEDCRSMDALADSLLRATRTLKLPAPGCGAGFLPVRNHIPGGKRAGAAGIPGQRRRSAGKRTHHPAGLHRHTSHRPADIPGAVGGFSVESPLHGALPAAADPAVQRLYRRPVFYVGCNLIAIIEECYLLTCLDWAASPKGSLILFLSLMVFFILLQSATCVMLLFSKSVKKFLYSQRNG